MQSKLLPISATDILTLHRLTEMSVVSAKESIHVVFREKNYSLYPKLLQSIKLMKMPKQTYLLPNRSWRDFTPAGDCLYG